jgi:hypothetical protein
VARVLNGTSKDAGVHCAKSAYRVNDNVQSLSGIMLTVNVIQYATKLAQKWSF